MEEVARKYKDNWNYEWFVV